LDQILDRGGPGSGAAVAAAVNLEDPATGPPPPPSPIAAIGRGTTWADPGAWVVLLVVTALGLGVDLWTKHWAFDTVAGRPVVVLRQDVLSAGNLSDLVPPHAPMEVVPGLLNFTLVLNPGAVFGIGAGKRVFFIVFTVLALGFGLWMFGAWTRPGGRDRVAHAAIGLLLAGGLGNLYDRLVFACVRDFIHPLPTVFWHGRPVWPYVSNVADLFLLIGIGILVVHVWRSGRRDGVGAGARRGGGDEVRG
jgi:signal peptidase II